MNSDRTPAPTGPLVLVVEDEPLLRLAAVEMVEDAGYVAVEAADAFEAVRILESRDDIRIVFTDIDMPGGMSGVTLAAAIRDRWPPIDIIMTSGAVVPADAMVPERGVFLAKPVSQRQFERTLEGFRTDPPTVM
ncbi:MULTISPECIES: response regulator [unclassified Brevundimonas]|nr:MULTISPECIES: response regulator [unclassified Brevundimonas]